jgi:creatinine deaminase
VSDLTELLEPALVQARLGAAEGGVPVGAALWVDGRLLGAGRNQRVQQGDPILHGETHCLQSVGRLPAEVYHRSTMVTTLSPCAMCTGAILLFGIPRVVIGENRTFLGAEDLLRANGVEVIVVDDEECARLMSEFITTNPDIWNEDIGVES